MTTTLNILIILVGIALIVTVVLQSKGAGLGGMTGSSEGGVYRARRGVEKLIFRITVGLSVVFFAFVIAMLYVS